MLIAPVPHRRFLLMLSVLTIWLFARCWFLFCILAMVACFFFFFQAEDGIRDLIVTGVQTCALPISNARDLGLAAVPRAFVCIDISTNQGRDTVGSLVWFEAGRPKKAEYRRFKIRGAPQDDFAAVQEVVTRHLTRRCAEGKPLPDLLVLGGGGGGG